MEKFLDGLTFERLKKAIELAEFLLGNVSKKTGKVSGDEMK